MLGSILFFIVWMVSSAWSLIVVIVALSDHGKVTAGDRVVVFLVAMPIVSTIFVFLWLLTTSAVMLSSWKEERSKKRSDKIKWKGPLVRIVEYYHNKRVEERLKNES